MRAKKALVVTFMVIVTFTAISNADETCLRAIAISGGEYHTLVLMENKTVWACGSNNLGRLGINDPFTIISPYLLQTHDGDMNTSSGFLEDIVAVDAGWYHSLAVDDINGNVWEWTDYDSPQKVYAGEQPSNSDYLENIVAIDDGYNHRLTIEYAGTIYGWGSNSNSALT